PSAGLGGSASPMSPSAQQASPRYSIFVASGITTRSRFTLRFWPSPTSWLPLVALPCPNLRAFLSSSSEATVIGGRGPPLPRKSSARLKKIYSVSATSHELENPKASWHPDFVYS